MKLTIDRNKWYRGKSSIDSRLLVESGEDRGKQCCVGTYLTALGVADEDLADTCMANDIEGLPEGATWLEKLEKPGYSGQTYRAPSSTANRLYRINDAMSLEFAAREYEAGGLESLTRIPSGAIELVPDDADRSYFESEADREQLIIKEFAGYGVEVEFVN